MKKMRKIIYSGGLSLALLVGISGCGSNTTGNTSSGSSKTNTSHSNIDFLFGDPNRTDIFSQITQQFNSSQTNVNVNFTPGGLNQLELLRTRLATHNPPDMTSQLQGDELAAYVKAGDILDIKNEPFMKKIKPSELQTVTVGDGVYGIPMDTQAWGVFYNKALFKKAGITQEPQTITELTDDVNKLNAAHITPFAEGYQTPWTIGQFLGYATSPIVTPLVQKNKAEYEKGNWTFNVPGMDQALNVLDLIINNTEPNPFNYDVSGQYALFAQGKAAMMPQGNWSLLQLRQLNKNLDLGFFPLPISNNTQDLMFPKQYGFVINILKNAKSKMPAIEKYVDYFLDPNTVAGKDYYNAIGIPTANATAKPKLDPASETLQGFMDKDKTVFTYYSYEPPGFDQESWKITINYIQSKNKNHADLIKQFDAAFKKFSDAKNKSGSK